VGLDGTSENANKMLSGYFEVTDSMEEMEELITRKAPGAVVFGTTRYGGIGVDHLTEVQSHGQLQYLLGHLRWQYTAGQLICMMMEFTQNVLEQSYKQYSESIIDENWITEILAHLEICKPR
jgi:hypothetical protein